MNLEDVKGVGKKQEVLIEAGIDSVEKLANASIDELTQLKGIGKATAEKFVSKAKELLGESSEDISEESQPKVDKTSENHLNQQPELNNSDHVQYKLSDNFQTS